MNKSLIQLIESYGWERNEKSSHTYDFRLTKNNKIYRLWFNESKREWCMLKDTTRMFLGQDATPEDIMTVIEHLQETIIYT